MISAATQPAAASELAAAKARPAAAAVEGSPEPVELKLPQTSTVQAPVRPQIQYDPEKLRSNLKAAIEDLNKQMASNGRQLGFHLDEALNGPVVTVRNSNTGEVIRQIPNEAVVKVAHTFESLKGLLHNSVV